MKSFSQFLTESPKSPVLADFPVIMQHPQSQTQIQNQRFVMNRYVASASAAVQAGGVLKSGYKDLSLDANRVAEYAIELVDAKYKHGGRWESLPKELQFFEIRPNHIGLVSSTLAKVEKLKTNHPYRTEAIAMLKELLPVEALVGYFKNHIVAKVSKADREAQAAYNAPQSTKNAKALVSNVLVLMTNEVKEQYIEQLETPWIESLVKFFAKEHQDQLRQLQIHPEDDAARNQRNIEARAKHQEKFGHVWGFREESRNPSHLEIGLLPVAAEQTRISATYQDPMHNKPVWTPKSNWKHLIHLKAVEEAEFMQHQFVDKNVGKLSSIVEVKGNVDGTPKVLNVSCRMGIIEGNIKFQFKDGAYFTVRNKIVRKMYENRGGQWMSMYQFPTTFHDAKLPNGKFMKGQPSERDMNEIFAGRKGEWVYDDEPQHLK